MAAQRRSAIHSVPGVNIQRRSINELAADAEESKLQTIAMVNGQITAPLRIGERAAADMPRRPTTLIVLGRTIHPASTFVIAKPVIMP